MMNERQLLKNEIFCYIKKYKYKFTLLYLSTALSNLLILIPLYLFGKSVDYIIGNDFNSVVKIVVCMVVIFSINTVLSVIETILNKYLNESISRDIKSKLYEKILKLKRTDFNDLNNGELLSKIENDSLYVANFITEDMIKIIISLITVFITFLFVVKLSIHLSIVGIFTFPVSMLLTNILSKKTRKYILKGKKLRDKNYSIIQETLAGIEETKCLSIEQYLIKKYTLGLEKLMKNEVKKTEVMTGINVLSTIITSLGEWGIILLSAWLIINSRLTIGTLVSFNSLFSKFTSSIVELAEFNVGIQNVYLSIRRISELLNLSDETDFETDFYPEITGQISMKNVYFWYDSNINILNSVNLKIESKSLYAIVGKNGCGKTSLLNIILRFYKYNKGDILLDGNSLKDIDVKYLRSKIAYIPQQPFIFQGTIRENVSIFNENLSIDKVINVCKLVGLDSFVNKLPNKYDTVIGKEGINLSGGQKQKLSIARGILREPIIMILDEITSDLDSNSEIEIMKLLNTLTKKFTIITVAHRISAILFCPNIIVMQNGEIVSQGSHRELIHNCTIYKELYEEQLQEIQEKAF